MTLTAPINANTGAPLRIETAARAVPTKNYSNSVQTPSRGTWLHLAHTGTGILLDRSSDGSDQGVNHVYGAEILGGLGFYRDQPAPPTASGNTSWTPLSTGYDIAVHSTACELDVFTLNSSQFIELFDADKTHFRKVRGHVMKIGIHIGYTYDIVSGEDIEFWPYWSFTDAVKHYTGFACHGLETNRADGLDIRKVFCFQQSIAWQVLSAAAITSGVYNGYPGGTTFGGHIHNLYGDSCLNTINVDSATNVAQISAGKVIAQPPDSSGGDPLFNGIQSLPITVAGTGAHVALGHVQSKYAGASVGSVTGNYSRLIVASGDIDLWNTAGVSGQVPAFIASGTGARIDMGVIIPGPNVASMSPAQPMFGAGAYPGSASFVKPLEAAAMDTSPNPVTLAANATLSLPAGFGTLFLLDSDGNAAIVQFNGGSTAINNTINLAGDGNGGYRYVNTGSPTAKQVSLFYSTSNGGTCIIKSGGVATTLYLTFLRGR